MFHYDIVFDVVYLDLSIEYLPQSSQSWKLQLNMMPDVTPKTFLAFIFPV